MDRYSVANEYSNSKIWIWSVHDGLLHPHLRVSDIACGSARVRSGPVGSV